MVSESFRSKREIRAKSGLATAEMRVVMLRIVEQASRISPEVVPTLFVDDLSVEVAGGRKFVHQQLVDFTEVACQAIEKDGMEVSKTKSVRTASDYKLGKETKRLQPYLIKMVSIGYSLKKMQLLEGSLTE
jgi:hypothetical protein